MSNKMEGLLKWSIDAANGNKTENGPDPKMLSQLLGAPDDVTLMREELRAAVESEEKDERIKCLEIFEEHVENVDNANNMGRLWEPLLFLINDEDADVRSMALSCVSAAVQNNDKAQADLVATKSGINTILNKINESDTNVSEKALLALSSAIGHCRPAYDQFVSSNGWKAFSDVFNVNFESGKETPQKSRSRVLSLLFSIALQAPEKSVHDKIDQLDLVRRLKILGENETGIIKEKIENILRTLNDNPRQEVRLLAQN